MVVIRTQQLDGLSSHMLRHYIERSLDRLRTVYPEHYYTRSDADNRNFVEDTIKRASSFGLGNETAVGRLMDYRLLLGSEFEETSDSQWMIGVLGDTKRSEAGRIRDVDIRLFGYTLEAEPHED